MKEVWRKINELGGAYSVSNKGRVKSHIKKTRDDAGKIIGFDCSGEGRIISGSNVNGYRAIDSRRLGKRRVIYIHRAVAMYFVKRKPGKTEVNHIDGNRLNNNAKNLEWVSHKENMAHAKETGLMKIGQNHTSAKLSRNDVLEIRAAFNMGCFEYRDFSRAYGTTVDNIRHIIKRRSWKHI